MPAQRLSMKLDRWYGFVAPTMELTYASEDRRLLEAGLQSRRLAGVACTNALELGVDISGVDAVITCGFPGTLAASLGGNVATNAGGMRAVKYGVTRNQVLGLEAVLGTGEVVHTGGRFVKNTSGYDLTQLIVGSEGTLALVTEATLKLHPRMAHTASILAPFASVDEVAEVVPRIVASGVQPMILEYIDRATMKGLLRMNELTLGVPDDVMAATEAHLIVVLEGRDEARLEVDVADVATQLAEAGAHDVYVLPSGQGADLLAARESAFWMVKAGQGSSSSLYLIRLQNPTGNLCKVCGIS